MELASSLSHTTTQEHPVYSYDVCEANCVLTVTAPDVDEEQRAPVSVSFVLDTSGSMHGDKMKLMRKASEFSLKELSGRDFVGLIPFASQVHHDLPLRAVADSHRRQVKQRISMLTAANTTNLAGGLFEGIKQQMSLQLDSNSTSPPASPVSGSPITPNSEEDEPSAATDPSRPTRSTGQPVRSVFLFTDGHPTKGVSEPKAIVDIMKSMLTQLPTVIEDNLDQIGNEPMDDDFPYPPDDVVDDGSTPRVQAAPVAVPPAVTVHTFGFGQDADALLLNTIAEAGSGSYYFIGDPEDIPAAFADALGGILSVAAQNIVLRITPVNRARIKQLRSGLQSSIEGNAHVVRMPDIYAEESKDLVVTFELPSMHGQDVPEQVEFVAAKVEIEFIDTVNSRPAILKGEMRVRRSAEAEDEVLAGGNVHVRTQMTRLTAMDGMLRAMSLADGGDYRGARGLLEGLEESLQSLNVQEGSTNATERELADAVRVMSQLRIDVKNMSAGYSSQQAYQGGGRAFAAQMSKSHALQRSTLPSMPGPMPAGASADPRVQNALPQNFAPVVGGTMPRVDEDSDALKFGSRSPAARPRSATGQDAGSPSKKSRVKMFLSQMGASLRRSSRDGEAGAAETAPPTVPAPAMMQSYSAPQVQARSAGRAAGTSTTEAMTSHSVYSNTRQSKMVEKSRRCGEDDDE